MRAQEQANHRRTPYNRIDLIECINYCIHEDAWISLAQFNLGLQPNLIWAYKDERHQIERKIVRR